MPHKSRRRTNSLEIRHQFDSRRRHVLKAFGSVGVSSLLLPTGLLTAYRAKAAIFDYYIGPNGRNSNSGSMDAPWAISALSSRPEIAGKRVGLLDGTYRLSGGNSDFIQGITYGGSASSPTVIESVNAGQAILTTNNGNGSYPQFGSIGLTGALQIEANYVTVRGLTLIDMAGHGINVHASHVLIENCSISNIVGQRNRTYADTNCGGIYFKESSLSKSDITIRNCTIFDIYNRTQNGAGDGTQLPLPLQYSNGVGDLFGVNGVTIEYCTFQRVGAATYLKGNAGNVIMRNCFVFDCGSMADGFTTVGNSPGNPATNYFYNNIAVVNRFGGAPSANINGGAASACLVYNNTFLLMAINGNNDAANYGYITFVGGGSQNLSFYNNIIYLDPALEFASGLLSFPANALSPRSRIGTMDYNLFNRFEIFDHVSGANYSSIASWRSALGKDNASIVAEPGFVNVSGSTPESFKLSSSSPAVGAGRVGGVSSGAAVDIGAWSGGVSQVGSGSSPVSGTPASPGTSAPSVPAAPSNLQIS